MSESVPGMCGILGWGRGQVNEQTTSGFFRLTLTTQSAESTIEFGARLQRREIAEAGTLKFGTTSGQPRSGNLVDSSRKRHQTKLLVFFPTGFASRGQGFAPRIKLLAASLVSVGLREGQGHSLGAETTLAQTRAPE